MFNRRAVLASVVVAVAAAFPAVSMAQNITRRRATEEQLRQSQKIDAITGDCSAGFITTVLPVTTAATVIPARIASGKFHGAMTTAV